MFFLLLVVLQKSNASTPIALSVGYNGSVFGNGISNIRNEVYHLNHFTYPNLDQPFQFNNFFHGLNIDLIFNHGEEKDFFYFMSWTQRRTYLSGSGTVNGSAFDMDLKYRFNNLTFTGFGWRINEHLAVAISPVNIGIFQVKYKNSTESDPKEWKDYHNISKGVVSSNIDFGSALYLDYYFSNHFRARLEGFYDWYGVTMRDNNNINFNYKYTATNLSLSVSYILFKED
ncbi:MAG: hypothetical protein NT150_05155 [Bacteroidetes bacterium]|nr:hypothetical protein [Bacteroidota bacterium]